MNHGKIQILILMLLMTSVVYARTPDKTFKVSLTGNFNYVESFQKRAELKLVRSTDFCRGFTIPTPSKAWVCKRVGGGEAKCETMFECGLIKRGFSRKSESSRLVSEINQLNMPKKKFSMVIARRPFKNIDRYKLAKQVEREKREKRLALQKEQLSRKQKEEAILRDQIKLRARRLKNEMTEMDEFSQLEQELDLATQKNKTDSSIAGSRMKTVEQLEAEAIAADQAEIEKSGEEGGVFGEDKELTQMESEDSFSGKPGQENAEAAAKESKFRLLSFGVGMYSISDDEESSVTTFGVLWSPLWKLNDNWYIKGNLSWHPYSATVDVDAEAESFSIYEIGAQVEWRILDGGLYVSAGYGIQSWGSSIGGSFSAISLGGGYYFEERKDRLIDYIFVKQTTVGNDTANVELAGGLGFFF